MPAAFSALFLRGEVEETLRVDLFGLLGADDTDFIVASTETATGVDDGVNMQL